MFSVQRAITAAYKFEYSDVPYKYMGVFIFQVGDGNSITIQAVQALTSLCSKSLKPFIIWNNWLQIRISMHHLNVIAPAERMHFTIKQECSRLTFFSIKFIYSLKPHLTWYIWYSKWKYNWIETRSEVKVYAINTHTKKRNLSRFYIAHFQKHVMRDACSM